MFGFSNVARIGVADFINAVPTDVPSACSYTFSATSIGDTNLLELGQVVFSGSNVTGIAYINNKGTLSTVAISGTLAPSTHTSVTSGGGRGAISPFNSTTTSLTVRLQRRLTRINSPWRQTGHYNNGRMQLQ